MCQVASCEIANYELKDDLKDIASVGLPFGSDRALTCPVLALVPRRLLSREPSEGRSALASLRWTAEAAVVHLPFLLFRALPDVRRQYFLLFDTCFPKGCVTAGCCGTPRAKNLRWGRPGRRRPGLHKRFWATQKRGDTKHVRGYALWGWGMTFVTLSLRYARPRIGVGSEFFCAPSGRCPRDSSKRNSSANWSWDSRGVCVI